MIDSNNSIRTAAIEKTILQDEQRRIVDEYCTLHAMFICSKRYIHSLGYSGEDPDRTDFQKRLNDIDSFYKYYSEKLNAYCKTLFKKSLRELYYEVICGTLKDYSTLDNPISDQIPYSFNFDFSLPEGKSDRAIRKEINKKSLQFCSYISFFLNDMHIEYSCSFNNLIALRITIICMLAAHIEHRETNIWEITSCIYDFDNLKPFIDIIEEYYDICVDVTGLNDSGKDNAYYPILLYLKFFLSSKEQKNQVSSYTLPLRVAISRLTTCLPQLSFIDI